MVSMPVTYNNLQASYYDHEWVIITIRQTFKDRVEIEGKAKGATNIILSELHNENVIDT